MPRRASENLRVFADADQLGATEGAVRELRLKHGIVPVYKMVDTCAGEFPSETPYLYGSYDEESEAPRSGRKSNFCSL